MRKASRERRCSGGSILSPDPVSDLLERLPLDSYYLVYQFGGDEPQFAFPDVAIPKENFAWQAQAMAQELGTGVAVMGKKPWDPKQLYWMVRTQRSAFDLHKHPNAVMLFTMDLP